MLVAPTELRHAAFRALAKDGRGSNKPENMGGDFAFSWKGQWYIAQRKEMKDFVASVHDGRLAQETQQMLGTLEVGHALLVVEGTPQWGLDGALLGDRYGQSWVRTQHTSQLLSLQLEGWWVLGTTDVADTARALVDYERWVRKGNHRSLRTRAGMVSAWGTKTNRDYQLHVLQGLPGVGYELATRLLDELGMIVGLRVTHDELLTVKGVGVRKADAICAALDAMGET